MKHRGTATWNCGRREKEQMGRLLSRWHFPWVAWEGGAKGDNSSLLGVEREWSLRLQGLQPAEPSPGEGESRRKERSARGGLLLTAKQHQVAPRRLVKKEQGAGRQTAPEICTALRSSELFSAGVESPAQHPWHPQHGPQELSLRAGLPCHRLKAPLGWSCKTVLKRFKWITLIDK